MKSLSDYGMKLNLHLHHLTSIIRWASEKLISDSPLPFSVENVYTAVEKGAIVDFLLKNDEPNGPVSAWAGKKEFRVEVGRALADCYRCGRFREEDNPLSLIISITLSAIDFHFDDVPPGMATQKYKVAQELGLAPKAREKSRREFEKKIQRKLAEKYEAELPELRPSLTNR